MDSAEKPVIRGPNAVVTAVGGGRTLVELDSGERVWLPELEGKVVGDRVTIISGHRPSPPVDGPAASG
jgi:hypothetical protein